MGLRKHHTNKASGGGGIPVELFQVLKSDVVKLHSIMPANLEKSAVTTGKAIALTRRTFVGKVMSLLLNICLF